MSGGRDLLSLQAATLFVSESGRTVRLNSPNAAPGPSLYLAGCAEGWIARFGVGVDDAAAREIDGLVTQEPPVMAPGAVPRFAERYCRLIGRAEPVTPRNFGPIHLLPHGMRAAGDARIVCQHTPEGDALWARLQREGVPQAMVEGGFTDLSHFWEPWCVAMVGDEIAAIAFAARLSAGAAELGLHTMKAFRRRRLAAAVTAAWSVMPALANRTLFYSTLHDNAASKRVIAQLQLPFVGESFRLP